MITYSRQPALPIAADGDALRRALRRANVSHDSRLLVTGPAGLAALVWLYRHDYPSALYIHADRIAATPTQGDVLLVPHACPAAELAGMLGDGHCVREGGALIVQATAVHDDERQAMAATLDGAGFVIEAQLAGHGHCVCVARRMGLMGFTRAA
jgi:hypothetical protein